MSRYADPHDGEDVWIDGAGNLTERTTLGDIEVVVHHADIPESDITVVQGMRCTTALRTMIDLAAELPLAEIRPMVQDCLRRSLFSVEQALIRIAEPDLRHHPGANALRLALA